MPRVGKVRPLDSEASIKVVMVTCTDHARNCFNLGRFGSVLTSQRIRYKTHLPGRAVKRLAGIGRRASMPGPERYKAGLGLLFASILLGLYVTLSWRARRKRNVRQLAVPPLSRELTRWLIAAGIILGTVLVLNLFRGVPVSWLILTGTAAAIYFLTRHTPFGCYLYAIGGNEEAAALSGIAVSKVLITAYALMVVTVALTGFMTTAYSGASTTTVGDLMELDAIAAYVIGGTALRGGRGTVTGVIFGTLIMIILLNGMTLLAVSPEIKFIARGVVLTLAVWLDVRSERR